MALNDTLINDMAQAWWVSEIKLQLRRLNRDKKLKVEPEAKPNE